jgi:hypothetical protein
MSLITVNQKSISQPGSVPVAADNRLAAVGACVGMILFGRIMKSDSGSGLALEMN